MEGFRLPPTKEEAQRERLGRPPTEEEVLSGRPRLEFLRMTRRDTSPDLSPVSQNPFLVLEEIEDVVFLEDEPDLAGQMDLSDIDVEEVFFTHSCEERVFTHSCEDQDVEMVFEEDERLSDQETDDEPFESLHANSVMRHRFASHLEQGVITPHNIPCHETVFIFPVNYSPKKVIENGDRTLTIIPATPSIEEDPEVPLQGEPTEKEEVLPQAEPIEVPDDSSSKIKDDRDLDVSSKTEVDQDVDLGDPFEDSQLKKESNVGSPSGLQATIRSPNLTSHAEKALKGKKSQWIQKTVCGSKRLKTQPTFEEFKTEMKSRQDEAEFTFGFTTQVSKKGKRIGYNYRKKHPFDPMNVSSWSSQLEESEGCKDSLQGNPDQQPQAVDPRPYLPPYIPSRSQILLYGAKDPREEKRKLLEKQQQSLTKETAVNLEHKAKPDSEPIAQSPTEEIVRSPTEEIVQSPTEEIASSHSEKTVGTQCDERDETFEEKVPLQGELFNLDPFKEVVLPKKLSIAKDPLGATALADLKPLRTSVIKGNNKTSPLRKKLKEKTDRSSQTSPSRRKLKDQISQTDPLKGEIQKDTPSFVDLIKDKSGILSRRINELSYRSRHLFRSQFGEFVETFLENVNSDGEISDPNERHALYYDYQCSDTSSFCRGDWDEDFGQDFAPGGDTLRIHRDEFLEYPEPNLDDTITTGGWRSPGWAVPPWNSEKNSPNPTAGEKQSCFVTDGTVPADFPGFIEDKSHFGKPNGFVTDENGKFRTDVVYTTNPVVLDPKEHECLKKLAHNLGSGFMPPEVQVTHFQLDTNRISSSSSSKNSILANKVSSKNTGKGSPPACSVVSQLGKDSILVNKSGKGPTTTKHVSWGSPDFETSFEASSETSKEARLHPDEVTRLTTKGFKQATKEGLLALARKLNGKGPIEESSGELTYPDDYFLSEENRDQEQQFPGDYQWEEAFRFVDYKPVYFSSEVYGEEVRWCWSCDAMYKKHCFSKKQWKYSSKMGDLPGKNVCKFCQCISTSRYLCGPELEALDEEDVDWYRKIQPHLFDIGNWVF